MFIVFIRTAILYSLVVIVMRLMGKRQIGELQPYEFVITIMISDLAALPMQDTKFPLLLGIIPIITLLLMKTLLSQLQLKSQFARKIIDGEPTILIFKGKINFLGIKKQQINIDELMEEIRLSGYFDLNEIQYAILENNGQLSILPTSQSSSGGGTQKSDSDASVSTPAKKDSSSSSSNQEPMLPKILVMDGKVNKNALTTLGKDEEWVKKVLRNHNIHSIKDVLLALYDTKGKFQYQLYDDYEKECSKCEIQ
ncbi:DUF421 domain-containing protein [Clostridium paraputrificum]|uniref:YetF domain-containing protein n=1 Tax=Clostridium TaxID=1485 RepID=UPI0006C36A19|nr:MULTISPECIES: DUF421 domain-containing protein [Clostridium]MDB2104659.1 DUF421 domain-containing protein [Clostridium paraputrificum]MDU4143223.1 DUF421 domain-containing protein [Clostridium sp.]MDY4723013.1 DUF421 domain-containing protein [Clostridium paraputrificum]CUO33258.1 Protein of uncharacterised function (DUF421) [Clostridium paraputrificum]SQB90344.1 Protein of uncharacterised function (DUF421) [Clostridium paraputrificum]